MHLQFHINITKLRLYYPGRVVSKFIYILLNYYIFQGYNSIVLIIQESRTALVKSFYFWRGANSCLKTCDYVITLFL